jgi:hypothetical protein
MAELSDEDLRKIVGSEFTNSPAIVDQPKGFQPKGFGGWLIVPALQTLFGPLVYASLTFQFLQTTRAPSFPTIPSSNKGLILFSLIACAVLTVGWSFVLVAMVRKKRWYPRGYAILGAASLACGLFLPVTGQPRWIIALFSYVIWTAYLFTSVRVKNTFDRAAVIARVFD